MTFDDYLSDYLALTVPERFVAVQLDLVRDSCHSIVELAKNKPLQLEEMVLKNIVDALDGRDRLVILTSGGADSAYLLSLVCRRVPHIDVFAYLGVTANNTPESEVAEQLCERLGVKLVKVIPNTTDLELQLKLFHEKTGRYPHDVAQPLHNYLVQTARRDIGRCLVIDGQYADTLMFANPQNIFVDFWYALTFGGKFSKLIPSRLRQRIKLVSRRFEMLDPVRSVIHDATSIVIWLCRLEGTEKNREVIDSLLQSYPVKLVLQVVFLHVLLRFRESDKYVLPEDTVSPFYSELLLADAWHNRYQYNWVFDRKRPIKYSLKMHHPDLYAGLRRRSFEPR